MERSYVEQDDAGYRVTGTRVSPESVVFAFREGWSPETIAGECFPTLTLVQGHGAIAYYLAHRSDIDAYLERTEATHEEERSAHEDPARTQPWRVRVNSAVRTTNERMLPGRCGLQPHHPQGALA